MKVINNIIYSNTLIKILHRLLFLDIIKFYKIFKNIVFPNIFILLFDKYILMLIEYKCPY